MFCLKTEVLPALLQTQMQEKFEENEHKFATELEYLVYCYNTFKLAGVSASEQRRGGVLTVAFWHFWAFSTFQA